MNNNLNNLVNRYKYDSRLFDNLIAKKNHDKYREELLKKRIERHKQQIADYVSNNDFNIYLKLFNL